MISETDVLNILGFEINAVTERAQSPPNSEPGIETKMSKPPVSDLARFRDNPAAIAKYLTEAFHTNDLGEVVLAINTVMRAQNVMQLAAATGLRRDTLYHTFGGEVNPQLGRVMELFVGLDVELIVKAVPPSPKPPRPKLGRPPSSSKQKAAR